MLLQDQKQKPTLRSPDHHLLKVPDVCSKIRVTILRLLLPRQSRRGSPPSLVILIYVANCILIISCYNSNFVPRLNLHLSLFNFSPYVYIVSR